MSAVISTEFQHRRATQVAAQDIAHVAQMDGYRQGYAVGQHDLIPHIQQALGVGVLFGTCIGVVLAIVCAGWLA